MYVERDFVVEFVVEALQPNRREGSDSKRSSRTNGFKKVDRRKQDFFGAGSPPKTGARSAPKGACAAGAPSGAERRRRRRTAGARN